MMLSFSSRSLLALALSSALGSHAASFPRPPTKPHGVTSTSGGSSVGMAGSGTGLRYQQLGSGSSSSTPATSVDDFQDIIYKVDIVLGGQTFTVQMDTGSSDLWVIPGNSQITLTNTTNITITEQYGSGIASGAIQFAQLEFGGFTIPYQAFLLAETAQDFAFIDDNQGAVGILGLSFEDDELSPVNAGIQEFLEDQNSTLGATPIFNIIAQNPSISNSFDVQLDRTGDLDDTANGTLIIGGHLQGYESVTSQPQLPRVFPGRWTVATDGMAVNGGSFEFNQSSVRGVDSGRIATLLDTGFTFPPLPPPAVDFIYSSIPGAVYVQPDFPQWIVPCMGTTNLTFTLGGVDFPVHPLDLSFVDVTTTVINGTATNVTFCYNTYQYMTLAPGEFDGFDAALGDSFLRNVYASFNYGDRTTEGTTSFVQLLSTTDLETAIPDFVASRSKVLASMPPEIDPQTLISSSSDSSSSAASKSGNAFSGAVDASNSTPSPASSSSSSPDSSSDKLYSLVDKYGPIIIGLLAGNVLIGVLLCVIGLVACTKGVMKSGVRVRNVGPSYAPVRFKEAEAAEESGMRYQD